MFPHPEVSDTSARARHPQRSYSKVHTRDNFSCLPPPYNPIPALDCMEIDAPPQKKDPKQTKYAQAVRGTFLFSLLRAIKIAPCFLR